MKRLVPVFLAVTMSFSMATTAFAASEPFTTNTNETQQQETTAVTPVDQLKPSYVAVTGKIKGETAGDLRMIRIEDEEGIETEFIIEADAYIYNDIQLHMGADVTVFYNINVPTTLQYPPRYKAAFVFETKDAPAMIGVFNDDLLSDDGSLVLRNTETANIFYKDNVQYKGNISNRLLAVYYNQVALSYPGQTSPSKIIVLGEEIALGELVTDIPQVEDLESTQGPEEVTAPETVDVTGMSIVVDGKVITAPNAYTNAQGVVMVPVRAIAEALGYEVTWEAETKTVRLGITMSLEVGRDYYVFARMAPIELNTAPENVNGSTYVPLSFFKEVARLNNAHVFEGQIVIDNNEVME